MTNEIIISGFGGQGVMAIGKTLCEAGMKEGKAVSWLPSYGPEMRGGTANCSVIISDVPVGSPIVSKPNVLMVMNLPSLDKYENDVKVGGKIFVDSSLIGRKVERTDVDAYYVPATQMASDAGLTGLANMILAGKILKELGEFEDEEAVAASLKKVVSVKHPEMYEKNLTALKMGRDY